MIDIPNNHRSYMVKKASTLADRPTYVELIDGVAVVDMEPLKTMQR